VGFQSVHQAVNLFIFRYICVCVYSRISFLKRVKSELRFGIYTWDVDPESYSFVLAHGEEQGVLARSKQMMHGAMRLHHGSGFSGNDGIRPNQPHYFDVSSRLISPHPLCKVNNISLLVYQVYYISC
jgi:hypothetical protein